MDFLTELQPWHWLIFAFLLLGGEALGAGGFLLGGVVAALLQAFLLWLFPVSWPWQLGIFGTTSLLFTIGWWVFLKKPGQNSTEPALNNRAAQLIGRVVVLEQDLPNGFGRIQVGDTLWKVKADEALIAGTVVVVIGAEGMTLRVAVKS